jgi:molecular chaperone GrpE
MENTENEKQETDIQNEETQNTGTENTTEELSEVDALKVQLAEQKEKYLRLFADFDNYKKRSAKERLELLNTAGKDIILSILPTIDDFERAILAAENAKDIESVKEGMILIKNKFFSSLEQRGLKAMNSIGEPFNPEIQEAITEVPAPNEEMKGKVLDVIEKGYLLNEKIIRFAKVVVGK